MNRLQLMGWNRMPPANADNASQLRFRVWQMFNNGDRIQSMLLGLPCASPENPFDIGTAAANAATAQPNPFGAFRVRVSAIAGQVIARNQAAHSVPYATTLEIDDALINLGRTMPTDFWSTDDYNSPDITERLMSHFFYNMTRTFLHLPYALKMVAENRYDYSRLCCYDAARALSHTYQTLRRQPGAAFWLSKIIDHVGFICSVVLILRMMGYRRSFSAASSEDQDRDDWKIISATTDILRQVSHDQAGTSASQAVGAIEQMLRAMEKAKGGLQCPAPGQCKINIPFFGSINIMLEDRFAITDLAKDLTSPNIRNGQMQGNKQNHNVGAISSQTDGLIANGNGHTQEQVPLIGYNGDFSELIEIDWLNSSVFDLDGDWNQSFIQDPVAVAG